MLFSYPGYYEGSFESAFVHFVKENIIIFGVTSTLQICLSAKEAKCYFWLEQKPEGGGGGGGEDLKPTNLLQKGECHENTPFGC